MGSRGICGIVRHGVSSKNFITLYIQRTRKAIEKKITRSRDKILGIETVAYTHGLSRRPYYSETTARNTEVFTKHLLFRYVQAIPFQFYLMFFA